MSQPSDEFTICVGTAGQGVWYCAQGGERWHKAPMEVPFLSLPMEIQVRALTVSPHDPSLIYAGSEVGLYRSRDRGATWQRADALDSPLVGREVWSVKVHPANP